MYEYYVRLYIKNKSGFRNCFLFENVDNLISLTVFENEEERIFCFKDAVNYGYKSDVTLKVFKRQSCLLLSVATKIAHF